MEAEGGRSCRRLDRNLNPRLMLSIVIVFLCCLSLTQGAYRIEDKEKEVAAPAVNTTQRLYSQDIVYNSNLDQFFMVYISEQDNVSFSIWGQKLDAIAGSAVDSPIPIFPSATYVGKKSNPSVKYNSDRKEYLVVFQWDVAAGNGTNFDVYGIRVAGNASSVIGSPIAFATTADQELNARCVFDSSLQNYGVIWEVNYANGSSHLVLQRLNASLDSSPSTQTTVIPGPTGRSSNPTLLVWPGSVSGAHYLVFFESKDMSGHNQLYASRLKATAGGPYRRRSWVDEPITVAYKLLAAIDQRDDNTTLTSDAQSYLPRATVVGTNQALVVWEVIGADGTSSVLARYTDAEGNPQDSFIVISGSAKYAQFPSVATNSKNESLIVYEAAAARDALGYSVNATIRAVILSASTRKITTKFSQVNSNNTLQGVNNMHAVVAFQNDTSDFIVVWENAEQLSTDPSDTTPFTRRDTDRVTRSTYALHSSVLVSTIFTASPSPTHISLSAWDKGKFFLAFIVPLMVVPFLAVLVVLGMLVYKKYLAESVSEKGERMKELLPWDA